MDYSSYKLIYFVCKDYIKPWLLVNEHNIVIKHYASSLTDIIGTHIDIDAYSKNNWKIVEISKEDAFLEML